ncbi:hypothetical protein [Vibrio superstes]|uniref:Lipoprotein n=1 Tax=Vibrio superstes NBRC 103154 TaxID=1219062 RepID=A0A511QKG2_9VIBR|nr:hypothetical protein [Vibrio superstes]GEM77771.1 hypothetical protein VSU01S_00160 [Vibrio superstes NBRC 103154]
MKVSKTAIAVAISSAFLFGCDFDIGSENNETAPPPEVTPPPSDVYSIENIYWDMVSDTTARSLSGTQPYLFANDEEGTRALSIYTGDVTSGYTFTSSSYSADEEGSVSFDGNQCTYTVADNELDMSCTKDGVPTSYSATEIVDEDVIAALENATDGKPATIEEVNAAIALAQDGDIIGLSASGSFNSGVIELNKAVILDGAGLAQFTGQACILVTAPGAEIRDIIFNNSHIGTESACVVSGSTARSGAIVITEDVTGEPATLTNLTINAENTNADNLNNKSSWIYTEGKVNLVDSTFNNLPSSYLNMAMYSACNKDKSGSVIQGNTFNLAGNSTSESAAIRLGNSSSQIVTADDCNFSIENNEFTGAYTTLQTDVMTSEYRPVAIHAVRASIANQDFEDTNQIVQ